MCSYLLARSFGYVCFRAPPPLRIGFSPKCCPRFKVISIWVWLNKKEELGQTPGSLCFPLPRSLFLPVLSMERVGLTPLNPSPLASFKGIPFRFIPKTWNGHCLPIAPAVKVQLRMTSAFCIEITATDSNHVVRQTTRGRKHLLKSLRVS